MDNALVYGNYTFLCRFQGEAILPPFKGSTFRGAFGVALKQVVCALNRQDCRGCLLSNRCIYSLFFERQDMPSSTSEHPVSIPHPFVLEPPLMTKAHFSPGDEFAFTLILFGWATNYLPYCIYAFGEMGKTGIGKYINRTRGCFLVESVATGETTIYTHADRLLKKGEHTGMLSIQGESTYPDTVTIHLQTPLRLKYQNHLNAELPFHILVRAALRRISSLFSFYCGREPDIDYKGLVDRATAIETEGSDLHWCDWERYSSRQDARMLMGGMTGSISYTGDLGAFMPILGICEKVHLGKQTTFGLGKIQLDSR